MCVGVSAGAPERPWRELRTGVVRQELPRKGRIDPGGKNAGLGLNMDVIWRPESTRTAERQSTRARERHNRFSR